MADTSQTYIVDGNLQLGEHVLNDDGTQKFDKFDRPIVKITNYKHGDEFRSDNEEMLDNLLRVEAIKLPGAILEPEQMAAREDDLKRQLAEAMAQLEEMRKQQAVPPSVGRGGKHAKAEGEASEAE